ncbi:MAG: LON peptidase substrate-binding domain-containing protein [Candidatus Latescibacterota bacterium]|jgi:Lon protease-like protein
MANNELPLFPLDMVLLPTRKVPLHIFEDRYQQMIRECLDRDSEFGLVWGTDDQFSDVGCSARIVQVVEEFPDGRMNIIIEGMKRFRVISRQDIHSYISGFVEDIEDDTEPYNIDLGNQLKQLYTQALKLSIGWATPPPPTENLSLISYIVAANLSLPHEKQQALLEETSVNNRLQLMMNILNNVIADLAEIKRRTRGNGHLA